MRIISLVALAVVVSLIACPGWTTQAESAEAEPSPVGVVGEVPPRPELEAVSGAHGWVVNGEEISLDEVRDRALAFHGPYVLQDMVAETLLKQEARRRNVTVADEDVLEKIKELREELGIRSDVTFQSFLRAQRATPDWFYSKARSYVLMGKVLSDQVYVDDREIDRYYRLNQEAYRRQEMVGFRAMRFLDKASAEAALAAVRQGRSFQDVAKETAPTAAEKAVAGDIQYYERGQRSLPPEFEAALFAVPLNQVAGPVEIMGSHYLIRVEKKIDPHQFRLDEIRDVIRKQLQRQKLEQVVWPNWIREQLEKARIEIMNEKADEADSAGTGTDKADAPKADEADSAETGADKADVPKADEAEAAETGTDKADAPKAE